MIEHLLSRNKKRHAAQTHGFQQAVNMFIDKAVCEIGQVLTAPGGGVETGR